MFKGGVRGSWACMPGRDPGGDRGLTPHVREADNATARRDPGSGRYF